MPKNPAMCSKVFPGPETVSDEEGIPDRIFGSVWTHEQSCIMLDAKKKKKILMFEFQVLAFCLKFLESDLHCQI